MSFPTHTTVAETQAFLAFSEAEWERWPGGPSLILSRTNGRLIGGSGLTFETPHRAATGYILAKDAWGRGYATETLEAMVALEPTVGVRRGSTRSVTRSIGRHRPCWRNVDSCAKPRCAIFRVPEPRARHSQRRLLLRHHLRFEGAGKRLSHGPCRRIRTHTPRVNSRRLIGMPKREEGEERGEPRDPIADYVEWTNNRHNPGHFLGGNIPPYLRKSGLGPRARRLAGLALAGEAVLALGLFASAFPWNGLSGLYVVLSAATVALLGWAAVAMFRSARRHRSTAVTAPKDPKQSPS